MLQNNQAFKLFLCFSITVFLVFQSGVYSFGQTEIESQELAERLLGFEDPKEILVNGDLMKAFVSAFQAFQEDREIPSDKKDLENYIVKISSLPESYEVVFFPKFDEGEILIDVGKTNSGQLVKYRVESESFKATKLRNKF